MNGRILKVVGTSMTLILIALFVTNFPIDSSVFNIVPKDKEIYQWDDYFKERERRNKVKMQISYEDLMLNGNESTQSRDWASAITNYYYAKSIYPDRIEPRRQLCYTLLMECQEDYRACAIAKREIYYATKYVHPDDKTNKEYLDNLVRLMDLEDIVELEEAEALAELY